MQQTVGLYYVAGLEHLIGGMVVRAGLDFLLVVAMFFGELLGAGNRVVVVIELRVVVVCVNRGHGGAGGKHRAHYVFRQTLPGTVAVSLLLVGNPQIT